MDRRAAAASSVRFTNGGASLRASLWSTEYIALSMLALYTLLDLVFFFHVRNPIATLEINIITMFAILSSSFWYGQTCNRIAFIARTFYVVPVGFMLYAQSHNYIPLINPHNYDATLAGWDYAIFGANPSAWFARFTNRWLTEYLQIWYSVFQLLLVVFTADFYLNKQRSEFRIVISTLLLGFCVSYLLYALMPAIGPRFANGSFLTMNRDMPGLFFTPTLRAIINAGNNITAGMHAPWTGVNPDCMPSGHTAMSVLAILLAWRYRSRLRWIVTVGGISVVFSTMYLQYHYVVDVMAGTLLALLLFAVRPAVLRFWERNGVKI